MALSGFQRHAVKGRRSSPYFPFTFEAAWVRSGQAEPIRLWSEDETSVGEFRGHRFEADDLEDLIDALPGPGELRAEIPVRVGRGDGPPQQVPLTLTIARLPDPRGDLFTRYVAELEWRGESLRAEADYFLDLALDQLRHRLWPEAWLICCVGCRWSRYGANTGWGELSCYVGDRERYDRMATSPDGYVRKYHRPAVDVPGRDHAADAPRGEPTDELYCCDEYAARPTGYGYSG